MERDATERDIFEIGKLVNEVFKSLKSGDEVVGFRWPSI